MTFPTKSDKLNPLWNRFQEQYTERLGSLRAQNDAPTLDAIATAEKRGRIAEIKRLIEMNKDDPQG